MEVAGVLWKQDGVIEDTAQADNRAARAGCRPRAAGGRPLAGLEFVEKLLTTNLTSTDMTERNAGMLRVLHRRVVWSAWLLLLMVRR
jgi:hypothetical protein